MATTRARILVAGEDALIRRSLAQRMRADGHEVVEAATGKAALECVREGVDLVLIDCPLPDMDGGAVLRGISALDATLLVIVLTSFASTAAAAEALKAGAFHAAHKPCDLDDIAFRAARALETTELRREVNRLRASQARRYTIDRIVGQSAAMEMLRSVLTRVATSPAPTVLLTGERGTGKTLAARVLHYISDRASSPFMTIACSLPEAALESELFGCEHAVASGTGEHTHGLLESAGSGTVVLDAIDEMAPPLQATLLAVLEDGAFRRGGARQSVPVKARVVAATTRILEDDVTAGRFRRDLFYRLNALPVLLPPLRQHREDIPAMVEYYVDRFNRELHKKVKGASAATVRALQAKCWPGNIRELRNAVERAMLVAPRHVLELSDFTLAISRGAPVSCDADFQLPACGLDLDALEQDLVTQALERCQGNRTRAAGLLGMNRDQIRYRIEKYGLPRSQHA